MSLTRQYIIRCDDGRYCMGAHLMLDVRTKADARKQARGQGWRAGNADQCPDCQHRTRPGVMTAGQERHEQIP